MKNKEQLLYFFLQGKISLSQYDYKFMANLQSIIQNNMRVTSNQAELFGKLISKYTFCVLAVSMTEILESYVTLIPEVLHSNFSEM